MISTVLILNLVGAAIFSSGVSSDLGSFFLGGFLAGLLAFAVGFCFDATGDVGGLGRGMFTTVASLGGSVGGAGSEGGALFCEGPGVCLPVLPKLLYQSVSLDKLTLGTEGTEVLPAAVTAEAAAVVGGLACVTGASSTCGLLGIV